MLHVVLEDTAKALQQLLAKNLPISLHDVPLRAFELFPTMMPNKRGG